MTNSAQCVRQTSPLLTKRAPVLVSMLMIVVFMAAACTFEVQPIEEYRSQDGYLSFTFPVTWDVLAEDTEDGTTAVLVGSHPELLDFDIIPAGQAGVAILLLPDFLPNPDNDRVSITPELMADLMRQSFMSTQESATEIEPMTLQNGILAYTYTAYSPEGDMIVHTFSPEEKVIAVVAYMTAPGEHDNALLEDSAVILNSVRFRGDPAGFSSRASEQMDVVN